MELTKETIEVLQATIAEVIAPLKKAREDADTANAELKETVEKQATELEELKTTLDEFKTEHDGTRDALAQTAEQVSVLTKFTGADGKPRSLPGQEAPVKKEQGPTEPTAEEVKSHLEKAVSDALPEIFGGAGKRITIT